MGLWDSNGWPNLGHKVIRIVDLKNEKIRTWWILWKGKQIVETYQRAEKAQKHEGDCYTNNSWDTRNSTKGLGMGNQRENRDHTDDSIFEIG